MADQSSWLMNNLPLLGGILGGPLGGIAGFYGQGIKKQYDKAGEWNQKAEDTVNNQISDLGSWYKKESGTSFLQTEAVSSALEQLKRTLSETLIGQNNNAVTGGATFENQLSGRKVATQQYGDAVNKLVGYGTDRQDQLTQSYQTRLAQWLQAKMNQQMGRAQNYSTAAENMIQAPFELANSAISGLGSLAKFAGGGIGGGGGGGGFTYTNPAGDWSGS